MDYKSELKAHEAGDRIVEELRKATGLPWGKRVWTNMGWHCEAKLNSDVGSFDISENMCFKDIKPTYSAYASPDGLGGHSAYLGDVPRGDTPVEAFNNALKQIKAHRDKIQSLFEFGTLYFSEIFHGSKRVNSGPFETVKDENDTIIGLK